jgi:hypothetical protein
MMIPIVGQEGLVLQEPPEWIRIGIDFSEEGDTSLTDKVLAEIFGVATPTRKLGLKGDSPEPVSGGANDNHNKEQKRWASTDKVFWGVGQTYDGLPPGVYTPNIGQNGPYLVKNKLETDDLINFPDSDVNAIVDEFVKFWGLRDEFKKRGFLSKRGFLLWGPPGSGKTCGVSLLIQKMVKEYAGIVLLVGKPSIASACLQMIRNIEADTKIILVMEDIDALVESYNENEFLALLDGEAQVDNIVFVGTTNYPERLDKRFIDRPSRFDNVKYIPMPGRDARALFFKSKEPTLTDEELNVWADMTDGFSLAHCKEVIIAVKCFGQTIEEVVERLNLMHTRRPTSDRPPDSEPFGFAAMAKRRELLQE